MRIAGAFTIILVSGRESGGKRLEGCAMTDLSRFPVAMIYLPERREIKKIISLPARKIYINLSAAPEANIIRLVQREGEAI